MRRPALIAVARALIVLATSIGGSEMALADFPDASTLPSRPELPDPLVMLDGSRVTSPEQWLKGRRPELKALFEHYMYGKMPAADSYDTSFKVEREDPHYLGDKATKKEVRIILGNFRVPTQRRPPMIHLLLVIPNKRTARPPTFLGLNFNGNHTALADPTIPLPTAWMPGNPPAVVDNKATDAGRGKDVGVWSVEKVIDRGYALAMFYCGDVRT